MDTKIISKLRSQTGAGILDCKGALEEAGGDIQKASEILRKKGIAKAAKRSGREASEGIILADVNESSTEGYILEVNAETDFVVRNDQFQSFVKEVFELVKNNKPAGRDELLALSMRDGTVQSILENLSGTIGEKLDIKDVAVLSNEEGFVVSYVHAGGRIGVLVSLAGVEKGSEIAHDIAMQVAATDPKYLKPEEVSDEDLEKEKDIYREQLKSQGKPEEIIEKIIQGKLGKFYEEICLLNQQFIKDDKKTVEQILGKGVVKSFIRYQI